MSITVWYSHTSAVQLTLDEGIGCGVVTFVTYIQPG